jgi:4-diphosphocytidyl-2-C-methyl-D-erythritol kinase
VPFFLGASLAVAQGREELLTPLPPWPRRSLVLANPGIPVSTAWAYREASSKLTGREGRVTLPALTAGGPPEWPPVWAFNRLEEVVLPHRPELLALKTLLQEGGGMPVLMSGSGASVFAVVPDAGAAEALAARVRESGAFAAAVTTLPANPMLGAVT